MIEVTSRKYRENNETCWNWKGNAEHIQTRKPAKIARKSSYLSRESENQNATWEENFRYRLIEIRVRVNIANERSFAFENIFSERNWNHHENARHDRNWKFSPEAKANVRPWESHPNAKWFEEQKRV